MVAALVAAVGYVLIGRLFPAPADHVRAWRLAAWIVSGVVFAAHIAYEHFALRHAPRPTALHAATGVALGAAGLAFAAMMNSITSGPGFRPVWFLALVAWPAITAVPAFVVALAVAAALKRLAPRGETSGQM